MPDGIVQWFDPARGEGRIVRANREYPVNAADMTSEARTPGARVHFDVARRDDVAVAVHVELRAGTRTSHRRTGFGALTGARRPDTKGSAPFPHPHPELGRELGTRPMLVARTWARLMQASDLERAVSLYAPDAVVHTPTGDLRGRTALEAFLHASGLLGRTREADLQGRDSDVLVRWNDVGDELPPADCLLRIRHGEIVDQWTGPFP